MQSSESQVDAILSRRFPGPLTFYRSRKKWLLLLLIGGLFTAGGFWMVSDGASGGWFVLAFFACGSVVAATMLLPGAGALTLDGDGFQATTLFRRRRSRWRDVTGFEPVSIPPSTGKLVVYDDSNLTGGTMAKLSTAIAGRNAGLPDTYGLSAEDLARLMTLWRDRALAASLPSMPQAGHRSR